MRKHPRGHIINERLKHRRRIIERMKWRGAFIPPMPYHCVDFSRWWQDTLNYLSKQTDRKPCSCYLCGNQRRHWGTKPIQERREDLRSAEIE